MRNEGVTILQIVVTVVIMTIIAAVSIFYGQNTAKEAKIASIYNEIKEIKSALKEAYLMEKIDIEENYIRFFSEVSAPKVEKSEYAVQLSNATGENFYYLDFTSSKRLENTLNLEKVKNDYILDFDNLNIYMVDGIEINEVFEYDSDEISKFYVDTFVK